MLNLKNHALDELVQTLAPFGVGESEARRIFAHVFAHGRPTLAGVRGIAARTLDRLNAELPRLTLSERDVSPTDGFTKYLFRTADGGRIESVLIPLPEDGGPNRRRPGASGPRPTGHYTMCISSQVG